MKIITSLLTYTFTIYIIAVLFTLYGVAMGFISTDSQDVLSQSIRGLASLF